MEASVGPRGEQTFSPCELATEKAEPLKRTSQRQEPGEESDKGKQRGGNWASSPKTKPAMKTKSSRDVQKESWLSQKLLQKKEFSGIKTRVGGDKRWGNMCIKRTSTGWHGSCLLSSLVFTKAFSPHYSIVFSSAIEKSKVSWLVVYGTWTNGNYQPIIPLRGTDVSINYNSWVWVVYSNIKTLLWTYNLITTTC